MPPPAVPPEAELALRQFRLFYQELFAIKYLLVAGDWTGLIGRRAVAGTTEEQVLLAVRLRLRNAITTRGFPDASPRAAHIGIDPGYVWAAVADAILLHDVVWPGRDGWAETPLEVVLYRSRVAGDRIFQIADDLARRRIRDADGMVMTILLAFQMGFRGRYRGSDDHGEIDRLKSRLFELIFHAAPLLSPDIDSLITGATQSFDSGDRPLLPRRRPWAWAIAGVFACYLVLSGSIWWNGVSDMVADATRATETFDRLSAHAGLAGDAAPPATSASAKR